MITKRYILSVAALLASIVVSLLCLRPVFHTTDDVGLLGVASGIYGQPDQHMLFSHIFFGRILKELYTVFPRGSWFELSMTLSAFASYSIVFYLLERNLKGNKFWVCIAVLTGSIGLFFVCRIHYAFAAMLPATAALMLLYEFHERLTGKRFALLLLASAVLITFGVFFRPEVVIMIASIFAPLFVIDAFYKRNRLDLVLKKAAVLITVFAVAFSLYFQNQNYYNTSKEWAPFWSFFKDRAMFTDYGVPYNEEAAKKVGWSKNDYMCVRLWFYADTNVYSPAKLKTYISAAPTVASKKLFYFKKLMLPAEKKETKKAEKKATPVIPTTPKDTSQKTTPVAPVKIADRYMGNKADPKKSAQNLLGNYFTGILHNSKTFLWLIAFTAFFIKREKRVLIKLAGAYSVGLLLILAMTVYLKLPPASIILCIFSSLAFINLMFLDDAHLSSMFSKKKTRYVLSLVFLLGFTLFTISWHMELYAARKKSLARRDELMQHLTTFRDAHPNNIFLYTLAEFSYSEFVLPFDADAPAFMNRLKFIRLGSFYGSPIAIKLMNSLGVYHISEDLFRNPKMLLFSNTSFMSMYADFVEEHYGKKLSYHSVDPYLGAFSMTTTDIEPLPQDSTKPN